MELVALWVGLSVVAGIVAGSKGRNGFGYFLISLVVTPIIGILLAALLPSKAPGNADDAPRIRCHQCAELVIASANVCKHCGAALAGPRAEAAAQEQAAQARDRALRAQSGYSIGQDLANMANRLRGKKKP